MIVRIHSNPTFSVGTMLSCLFFWTGLATAQTATVQGRVTNATDHAALEGVTITNLSMPVAARTDKKGNFNIRANAGDRLKVSLLGFKTIEIAVPSTGNLQIALNEESRQIDEVVVTALGIKRQTRGLTYATQQLDGSAVNDVHDNSGNVLSSLTGKVAGAVVTTAATGPGASAKVVLRGNKSISGNNNALIVVDGVPYDNSSAQQATGTTYNYGTSDGAANINPDDIESINVLKGSSAAALYGSRAANGAILITTKQGKAGRYNIDYNGSASLDQVNLLSKFQNTYGRGNGGVSGTNVGESWGPQGQTYKNNVRDFFENATSFNNSISTYGGTEKVPGYVSYTNNKIGGIVPGNDLKRNNLNLRMPKGFFIFR